MSEQLTPTQEVEQAQSITAKWTAPPVCGNFAKQLAAELEQKTRECEDERKDKLLMVGDRDAVIAQLRQQVEELKIALHEANKRGDRLVETGEAIKFHADKMAEAIQMPSYIYATKAANAYRTAMKGTK